MLVAFMHDDSTARPAGGRRRPARVVSEASQAGHHVRRRDIAGRVAGKYGEEGSPRGSHRSHGGGLPAGRRPR